MTCLSKKLQAAVPEVDWDDFVEALRVSGGYILRASEALYK